MSTPDGRVRTHIPPPKEIWPISELVRQVGRIVADELGRPRGDRDDPDRSDRAASGDGGTGDDPGRR